MKIALVGKYVQLEDAYKSVVEALRHSGFQHGCAIEIDWVDSETLDDSEVRERLADADGILIPGGFGVRGIEGKIQAARIAREERIPFLGVCLGMQMAVADFARHVVDMPGANSTEFDPETPYPVIDLLPEQKEVSDMGGTMRLGADPMKLHEGTLAREIYGEAVIYERHRHRYEVNNFLRRRLEAAGLVISGTSPDERLVEIIEIADHPFFVASQFHPEFKSRPERPAPLFRDFVGAAYEHAGAREPAPRRGRDQPGVGRRAEHALGRGASSPARRMRPASDAERARLNDTFAALCRIPSPFGHERACSDHVRGELRAMRHRGGGATPRGNLLARLPGRGERSILLCAHLDTVDDGGVPIEPVIVDGGWENANDGILGADNKAAVAVILELARRCSVEGSPVGIELLFTIGEENALEGAKEFDVARLQSDFGYVFDHATPIGEVVTASPTYFRLAADFHGRAAHAGIRPEAGRSAILAAAHAIARMPLGRIDEQTTANVGSIQGGAGSTNIVPERCRILAETRSLDAEPGRGRRRRHRRRHPRRRRARRVRRRRRLRAAVRRLPPEAERARGRGGRGGAARLRLRAAADRHRRRVGRQRARGRRLPVREPRQRHRAQPRADRARRGRRARGHARRRLRPARRGGRGMSSRFEPVGGETRYEGKIFSVREETFRHEDGEEATREIVRHQGAVGVVCPRRRARSGSCASRARRSACPTCSSSRPASSTSRARSRWRPPSASWPRRSARPRRSGSTCTRSTPRRASPTRSATSTSPPGCRTRRRRRTSTSASTSRSARWPSSTRSSTRSRDSKTLIGLLELRRRL